MDFKHIPIPGGATNALTAPRVRVVVSPDLDMSLVLSYEFYGTSSSRAGLPRDSEDCVRELAFRFVREYRFVWSGYAYDNLCRLPFSPRQDLRALPPWGLVEVIASPYISRMASSEAHRASRSDAHFANHLELKHCTISWDEYGKFDVVALGVETSEYEKDNL